MFAPPRSNLRAARWALPFLAVCLLANPPAAPAAGHLAINGFAALGGSVGDFPDTGPFFPEPDPLAWDATLRLLVEAETGPAGPGLSLNLRQTVRSAVASPAGNGIGGPPSVERSGLLAWRQGESSSALAMLELDTGLIRRSWNRLDLTVGRQPVNLATTFFFTPNDLFAPFAAQTFFRVYKPGVDGARAEIRLANLAQLTLLVVLGYAAEPDSDTGWSDTPALNRTSLLGRYLVEAEGFQWGLLAGTLRNELLAGGSLQGEVGAGLGLRAEAHGSTERGTEYLAAVVGLEYRLANGLDLRCEQYRDTRGFATAGALNLALNRALTGADPLPGRLGRDYSAFGMNYQFTPLLSGAFLLLTNWSDRSGLATVNAVYSLADNSELAFGLAVPWGREPDGDRINSEFGLSPTALSLDFRHFF